MYVHIHMSKNMHIYVYIYIYIYVCCRLKEKKNFRIGRPMKRFVFFSFIYFVLTYVLYVCMFLA